MPEPTPTPVRVTESWGAHGCDAVFAGAGVVPTPWGRAHRRRDRFDYDAALVRALVEQPPRLVEIDPRGLRACQPSVTRSGVAYYLGDGYPLTGRTYADYDRLANRYPIVYDREDGQRLILSGHHRACAALLRGEPLLARHVRGPWGPSRADGAQPVEPAADRVTSTGSAHLTTAHLTPLLTAVVPPAWSHTVAAGVADAVTALRAGQGCHLPDGAATLAREILIALGLTPDEAARQESFARHGVFATDRAERDEPVPEPLSARPAGTPNSRLPNPGCDSRADTRTPR